MPISFYLRCLSSLICTNESLDVDSTNYTNNISLRAIIAALENEVELVQKLSGRLRINLKQCDLSSIQHTGYSIKYEITLTRTRMDHPELSKRGVDRAVALIVYQTAVPESESPPVFVLYWLQVHPAKLKKTTCVTRSYLICTQNK